MNPADRTLGRLFLDGAALNNPRALVITRGGADTVQTATQTAAQVHRVALALRRRGIGAGDAVAILAENRPEWLVADFGISFAGAAVVPLYMNLLPAQVGAILGDAKPRLVFASTPEQAAKVREAAGEKGPEVVLMDPPPGTELPHAWERFLASGAPGDADPTLEDLAKAQKPEALASILYTSGTTGEPKGVLLSHRNLVSATAVLPMLGVRPGREQVLSFLPLAHIFGRVVDLALWGLGASIAYAPHIDELPKAFRHHRPTVFAAVPRIFEKAYAKVQEGLATSPAWRRDLGRACIAAAGRRLRREAGPMDQALAWLGDRLIFRRVREGLGGRLRLAISGGAPLSPDILGFFQAMGVPIYEGYGLTEAGILTVNLPGRSRAGTVGPALPGAELRIAEDGEILARGPMIMLGFRKAELTKEAIDADGWFHTGDLGRIDADGFLAITGRKKELMKTAGGKYIAPTALEQRLLNLPFVQQAMAVGEGRPYPAALVVPSIDALRKALVDQGLGQAAPEALCADPRTLAYVEAAVEKAMEDLPRYERVKRVALLATPFTVEDGDLTPTLKMKRAVILKKHAAAVDALYARP